MQPPIPDRDDFIRYPIDRIHRMIYDQKLSISLLLNGTRRWYISTRLTSPPTDDAYLTDCLDATLCGLADLILLLTGHGIHRIFLPTYSWHQSPENPNPTRPPEVHKFLIEGIKSLVTHPRLVDAYRESGTSPRFYGDLGRSAPWIRKLVLEQPNFTVDSPRHYVHYGVDSDRSPHGHGLEIAYEFGKENGRAPTREDMIGAYYGDRGVRPLDILVGAGRFYSRMGVPYLLDGEENIYATAVTPLVMTEEALRKILYDFLFMRSDRARDYRHTSQDGIDRLREYETSNRSTVMGLSRMSDGLVYPEL